MPFSQDSDDLPMIRMITRGSGMDYVHPNVGYYAPSHRLSTGWYDFFRDVTSFGRFAASMYIPTVVANPGFSL